jgi:hypothetical protein
LSKKNKTYSTELIEKISVLIALEASKEKFPGKGLLEARVNFLSRPYTKRNFKLSNVEHYIKELIRYEKEGKNNIPIITPKGKIELYKPENKEIISEILGNIMVDLGNQFRGYGEFMQNLVKEKNEVITTKEFESLLKRAYIDLKEKEPRFQGLIPLDLIKKWINKEITISMNFFKTILLELEKQRVIDLQIAYDASSIKEPKYGIDIPGRGLVYFLVFRNGE